MKQFISPSKGNKNRRPPRFYPLTPRLLLPIVMSGAEASFTVSEATSHLTTNAWVIEQFLGALVEIRPEEGGARVIVHRRRQHV